MVGGFVLALVLAAKREKRAAGGAAVVRPGRRLVAGRARRPLGGRLRRAALRSGIGAARRRRLRPRRGRPAPGRLHLPVRHLRDRDHAPTPTGTPSPPAAARPRVPGARRRACRPRWARSRSAGNGWATRCCAPSAARTSRSSTPTSTAATGSRGRRRKLAVDLLNPRTVERLLAHPDASLRLADGWVVVRRTSASWCRRSCRSGCARAQDLLAGVPAIRLARPRLRPARLGLTRSAVTGTGGRFGTSDDR